MRSHLATYLEDFRRHGQQTAIVSYRGNRRIAASYGDLADFASAFANELTRRGIGMGDRVVLWGQNGLEWMGCFFGCVMRGVIAVPLDAAGSLDFAKRVIAETQPKLIAGDAVLLSQTDAVLPTLAFEEMTLLAAGSPQASAIESALNLDTPLQILFTSGTTAEPKGIVHTHRNVLASVKPIEREIQKYLRYERFVHPLRFLHTLPLSHVFGQFMGLWVPPLLAAEVHYESRLQAQRLMEMARRERISVLAAVPRVLELLRDALNTEYPELEKEIEAAAGEKVWKRWWHFRKVHRALGFKFWAFVCGGASLPSDLESFWNTLGFALIQGYGMTETAALITLNHPFKRGKGTIGKVLPGREVEIREDGEVLVRGDMVSTATWRNGAMQQNESPWLATGDLATRDEQGQLRFVGRKSQVIVTSSGLNVHPEDVEAALNAQPGVEASAVVPFAAGGSIEPFAVLLFRGPQQAAQQAVVAANQNLADFQRIRQWRVWPELDLPRTSTGKIQRRKVAEWVNAQQVATSGSSAAVSDPMLALILSITGAPAEGLPDDPRMEEDLRLDSLGRVQLQAELEQRMGLTLSDTMLEQVSTLRQLEAKLGMGEAVESVSVQLPSAAAAPQPQTATDDIYPRWTWSWPAQAARVAFLETVLRPLVWLLANPRVESELGKTPAQPLLIVANHVSTYDMPLILYALPAQMRRHVAAAMAANMLADWRHGRRQGMWFLDLLGPLTYLVVTGVFNVFPLPRSAGFRRSFQHAGLALDRGYNVLVFPEGHRTEDGKLHRFRPGIGLLAQESKALVLPVGLAGLGEMKMGRQKWFRSGKLHVRVGRSIAFAPNATAEEITERLQDEIAKLIQ